MQSLLKSGLLNAIISAIAAIVVAIITKKGADKLRTKEEQKVKEKDRLSGKSRNYLEWVIIGIAAAGAFVIVSLVYNYFTSEPTCDNLLPSRDELVSITDGPSRLDIITSSEQTVTFHFDNGQSYSGIAFKFSPPLKVRGFAHLEIVGTSTETFKFVVEYKVRKGIVAKSDFKSFPSTSPQTIRVPLKFDDKVDEITLMFYVKGEASQVTIESICLSK